MTIGRIGPAVLAIIGALAEPAEAERFRCQSTHPEVWGVLTIDVDPAAATITLRGDRPTGPQLAFANGRTGPVRQADSLNQFGSDSVRQIVIISARDILFGWLDPDGDFNYAATVIRCGRTDCRLRQLAVDLG